MCSASVEHTFGGQDVNFSAPFKFYRNEPRTVTIQAAFHQYGQDLLADCQVIGSRMLPNQTEPQVTTHFTGRVRLANQQPKRMSVAFHTPSGSLIDAAKIYRLYFHGPSYQVVERAWWDGNRVVGVFAARLPEDHFRSEKPTLVAPRLIELCFQTAGLWEMGIQGRMGLPLQVREIKWLRNPVLTDGRFYAVVTPQPNQESFDAEVIDGKGNLYLQLTGYRTIGLPGAVDAAPLKALQEAMSLQALTA
jgi:hypothetical protein